MLIVFFASDRDAVYKLEQSLVEMSLALQTARSEVDMLKRANAELEDELKVTKE